jgi:hypothetical protein
MRINDDIIIEDENKIRSSIDGKSYSNVIALGVTNVRLVEDKVAALRQSSGE